MTKTWRQLAAEKALDEVGARDIIWLRSGTVLDLPDGRVNGESWPLLKRVHVPWPETTADLATCLHEAGHLVTFRLDASYLENEERANTWALDWWRKYGLPDVEAARRSLQRGYEAAERAAAGKVAA